MDYLTPAQTSPAACPPAPSGTPNVLADQPLFDAPVGAVGEDPDSVTTDHAQADAHTGYVSGDGPNSRNGHSGGDTHASTAVAGSTSPDPANHGAAPRAIPLGPVTQAPEPIRIGLMPTCRTSVRAPTSPAARDEATPTVVSPPGISYSATDQGSDDTQVRIVGGAPKQRRRQSTQQPKGAAMSISTKLNLRELVLEVVASSTAYDVPTIAKEVSRRTEDHVLRDAYDQALPLFVQNTISTSRGPGGYRVENDQPTVSVPAQRGPDSATQSNRSWKRDGIRRYARELRELYATDFSPDSRKPLGEFTIADCESAMRMHDKIIEGNQVSWRKWAHFKTQMVTQKANKISQLPDTALAEAFGDAR